MASENVHRQTAATHPWRGKGTVERSSCQTALMPPIPVRAPRYEIQAESLGCSGERTMSDEHARGTAPRNDEWCVTRCDCGHITLQMGEVHQTFTAEAFEQFYRLVASAMRQFRVEGATRPAGRATLMH
jgi:hypothetical protein